MSPMPPLGQTGEDLYRATLPMTYAEEETGFAWAAYVGALSPMMDPIAEVVRDDPAGYQGWTLIGSPTRCPPAWLRVLAQWAGIRRWDAMAEADLRTLIAEGGPGFWRGTRQHMIAAIRRFLPPGIADKYVYFEERADDDAYKLRVFTYSFIPHDTAAVRAALLAAKPALIVLDYEVRQGQTYEMLSQRVSSYAEMREHYPSYAAVRGDEPLEGVE